MANNTSFKGFKPMKRADGAALAASVNPYRIITAYATDIFMYDMVTLATDGTITQTTSTGLPVGIFMGVQYTDNLGVVYKRPYWPASTSLLAATTVEAYVCDDPNIIFEAQFTTTSVPVQADVGALFDITVGTGTKATGLSGAAAAYVANGATTAKACRLLGFSTRADNDTASANPYCLFAFANHQYRLTTGI